MQDICSVQYTVICSKLELGESIYDTFGIRAVCACEGIREVRDVTLSLAGAAALCAKLNENKACCLHLLSICEDFVANSVE